MPVHFQRVFFSTWKNNIILSVRHLKQFFRVGRGIKRHKTKAVSNISFDVHEGECVGIVGESGCGKTTTGRSIIKLHDITSGSIYYRGVRISAGDRWNRKEIKYQKECYFLVSFFSCEERIIIIYFIIFVTRVLNDKETGIIQF